MKKFFLVMMVATLATIGFNSCTKPLDDAGLKDAITGKTFEGTYSQATISITTFTGYTYTMTLAAEPMSAGSYDVKDQQMIMTDVDQTIYTANVLDNGKTLELLKTDGTVGATLKVVK